MYNILCIKLIIKTYNIMNIKMFIKLYARSTRSWIFSRIFKKINQ